VREVAQLMKELGFPDDEELSIDLQLSRLQV
jgi:hypothetical protein